MPQSTYHTVVIGGGQAGLSVGYHLKRAGLPFVILDASERTGDAWRNRWDSLRVFTPARYCDLHGMPFAAPGDYFPTKDEIADYLQEYSLRFELPIMHLIRVEEVSGTPDGFRVKADGMQIEAENVVIAMNEFQKPRTPSFASELDEGLFQIHSKDYRRPAQLRNGDALVVGAGNSGVEIALDLAGEHDVYLSGRHPGHIPLGVEHFLVRKLLARFILGVLFHHTLTVANPIGRKVQEKRYSGGHEWVRAQPEDVEQAGITRVPRVSSVEEGRPRLEDGRVLDVANVIWATGFAPGFDSWVNFDIFEVGRPRHDWGVVGEVPGLYFVGLDFLRTPSSGMFHGVGRDALHVVEHISARSPVPAPNTARTPIH